MKAHTLPLPAWFTMLLIMCSPSYAATTPNIVVILSDDFGYGSAGCYGADPAVVTTPNIDRLATEGMLFRDANTPSSVCSPTRYALLTGRYVWRSPMNRGKVVWTLDPLSIELDRPTLPGLLKSNGYATGFVGKWHLGYGLAPRIDYTEELKPGPLELGFDYQFAVPQNHGDFTRVYVENHTVYGLRSKKTNPTEELRGGGDLGLDAPRRVHPETMETLTDKAVAWLGQTNPNQPFFLYFAPVAVHGPITPSAETEGTTKAGPYGDFIRDLDLSVGRILAALDEMGVTEDTLVIFTSDNGGVSPGSENSSQWQATQAGLKINGHLRGRKHSIFQGGFQVPFLARWPGHIEPGSESDSMIGLIDIYATLADLMDQWPVSPQEAAPDSISFLPDLLGTGNTARNSLILHSSDGVYAIRSGKWKLIEGNPFDPADREKVRSRADEFSLQLYNLEADPSEEENLTGEENDKVRALLSLLTSHRNQGHSR